MHIISTDISANYFIVDDVVDSAVVSRPRTTDVPNQPETNMQQVTARVHKEHDFIELFFWSAPGDLTSYSFREGHAPATLEYMRTRTAPAGDDPRAEKLFRYWCGLPGHAGPVKLVKRLSASHK